ncbi:MAG: pseudouridylate synthase [Lentimicrobiaceae bacterium]|nr:pseudouridylate synthase [Lentimicrobiaceae bacterium]
MEIKDIDILTLIPQRRPFVMIDRLLSFDEIESSTDFVIKEDNIFCKDGLFLETGIMENIAQTCAARIGYININNNESVKIGVIGSIKDLIITKLPKVGTTLVTKVKVLSEVFAITLVEAEVYDNEELIAKCEMKISLTDKEIG